MADCTAQIAHQAALMQSGTTDQIVQAAKSWACPQSFTITPDCQCIMQPGSNQPGIPAGTYTSAQAWQMWNAALSSAQAGIQQQQSIASAFGGGSLGQYMANFWPFALAGVAIVLFAPGYWKVVAIVPVLLPFAGLS